MTTRPNKTNPTGITNYKIPAGLAALPEWQDLAQAMNRCALAADGTGVTQSEWIDAVQNLASGVAFMDCCSTCERRNDAGELVDTSAAPATTEIEGRWMRGTYICRHGHVWRCGYSVTFPVDLR